MCDRGICLVQPSVWLVKQSIVKTLWCGLVVSHSKESEETTVFMSERHVDKGVKCWVV